MTTPDVHPRRRLLDAALTLLADEGPDALQARKVSAAAGASTMAVYTHFGGMRHVVDEVAREGFRLLDEALGAVPETADPVTDLCRQGIAYRQRALDHPHLYRLMFGLTAPGGNRIPGSDLTAATTMAGSPEGEAAFARLVTVTTRCIDAGRLRQEEPVRVASQIWSSLHGYVLLELSGYFGAAGEGVPHVMLPLATNLLVGLGDTREAVQESAAKAMGTN